MDELSSAEISRAGWGGMGLKMRFVGRREDLKPTDLAVQTQ